MKLTFFLVGLFLVLLRICLPNVGLWRDGREQGTMISNGDNFYEGIWWSGKYRLSDDDRSITGISPGGYLKYRQNDTTMKLESDLQGRISYKLYNGSDYLPLDDSGRRFLAAQLQKMIRLGFFGDQRAERIYRQGGVSALLAELSRIKMEGGRDPYLKIVFRSDSLTTDQCVGLLRLIDSSSDMAGRQHMLEQFRRDQLRDPAVEREWLAAVGHLDASYMKKDLFQKHIDSSLTADRFDTVLAITSRFGADVDEQDVYKSLLDLPQMRRHDSGYAQPWLVAVGELGPSYMKKDLLLDFIGKDTGVAMPPRIFNSMLRVTSRFGTDIDEQEVYTSLMDLPEMRRHDSGYAQPWLAAVSELGPSYMKKDLLLGFIGKDPDASVTPGIFDAVLTITSRFGTSVDEQEVYKQLANLSGNTAGDWAGLIRATAALDADYMKGELLRAIAQKMPRTDGLLMAYRTAAKTIQGDDEYGKTMRAVE